MKRRRRNKMANAEIEKKETENYSTNLELTLEVCGSQPVSDNVIKN